MYVCIYIYKYYIKQVNLANRMPPIPFKNFIYTFNEGSM